MPGYKFSLSVDEYACLKDEIDSIMDFFIREPATDENLIAMKVQLAEAHMRYGDGKEEK